MWAADKHRIEATVLMNRRLLRAISLNPALAAVRWVAFVELIANAVAILMLGSFAADHFAELRFTLPNRSRCLCDRAAEYSNQADRRCTPARLRRNDHGSPETPRKLANSPTALDAVAFRPCGAGLDPSSAAVIFSSPGVSAQSTVVGVHRALLACA